MNTESQSTRARSPSYINLVVCNHPSEKKAANRNKIKAKKNKFEQLSGFLNRSKMSTTSSSSMFRSKSNHMLPVISGNDLKAIKEIFTKAKQYKDRINFQKVPIKNLPKSNVYITKPSRMKSISIAKDSNKNIENSKILIQNNLQSNFIKNIEMQHISTPSKTSSLSVNMQNFTIVKCSPNKLTGSCPELPSLSKKNIDSSLKK